VSQAYDASRFIAGLEQRKRQLIAAAVAGVRDAGLQVLGNAQEITPVGGGIYSPRDPAPGTLQASATWDGPNVDGTKIVMVLGFNTIYAAVQHEQLDFRHEAPGQAKYLEIPMRQAQESGLVQRSIGLHVDRIPKGGGQ
jgi:hypothetical protein